MVTPLGYYSYVGSLSNLPERSTPDRFAWLLSSAVVVEQDPTSEELEAAWEVVRRAPLIMAWTGPRLIRWAQSCHTESSLIRRIHASVTAARVTAWIQLEEARRVSAALRDAGIEYVLLDSVAAAITYDDPLTRRGRSIDVAAELHHAPAIERALHSLGYRHGHFSSELRRHRLANPLRRAWADPGSIEETRLVRRVRPSAWSSEVDSAVRSAFDEEAEGWCVDDDGRLVQELRIEVHHHLLEDPLGKELLVTARVEEGLSVPSPAWGLLLAVSDLYPRDGAAYRDRGLHRYLDMLQQLARARAADLGDLRPLLDARRLLIGAYYLLRRAETVFASPIPESLRSILDDGARVGPEVTPGRDDDFGDPWPRLWGYR